MLRCLADEFVDLVMQVCVKKTKNKKQSQTNPMENKTNEGKLRREKGELEKISVSLLCLA